ncbi:MAG TPA: MaoC/PaaZ C-terminal domain-containing protein [Candidatus Binataceae bacterium]|jgi:acyl dehydratase|nr:MaoC/PaaZ C-terminal domain-containing protein [Candidatus Binataceae bacterium]
MSSEKRFGDAAARVGDEVPPLERTLDQVRMVAYAGATWDWHRLHYEPAYAAARNFKAPVVDGQMLGALLAEALLDWLGPRAFIRRMNFRLRGMVFAGDTVRCEGEVVAVVAERDCHVIRVAQRVRVGELVVVEPAGAEIAVPCASTAPPSAS